MEAFPVGTAEHNLTEPAIDAIAADLVGAWDHGTFVAAPTRRYERFSRAVALAVAERIRTLRIAAGAHPAGYKVGFTNATVREQFAADGPFGTTVYDQTICLRPRIDARRLLGPRIEPEVVVGVGTDGEIAWAALGFEIVQSHVRDWKFSYLDALADFGLHAALVIGERRPIGAVAGALGSMAVTLRCDGAVVERGRGSDVDGGALGSLAWLRADLRRVNRELQPGEVVSTGSMTRVPAIAPGQRWTLEAIGGELPALALDVD